MLRKTIANLIKEALFALQREKKIPLFDIPDIVIEEPKQESHGDYSSNIALNIARIAGRNPMEMAGMVREKMNSLEIFKEINIAKPGFINFILSEKCLYSQLKQILEEKEAFGDLDFGKGRKINIEFISANPTGPLHIGNCRGGFCGDVLANVLEKAGYEVWREYYVNNRGSQVTEKLKLALEGKEGGYKGEYIQKLRERNIKDPQKAAKIIFEEYIKPAIKRMGIRFDRYFFEDELYKEKETDKVLALLQEKNLVYEKEKALWFRSSRFGDSKDRVLIKNNGQATYFLSDIVYLENKFRRGFDYLIFFWGAEHHGYISRIKAGAEALGYSKNRVIPLIVQLVKLMEKGKEVKMSKRAGVYVTVDELIQEVGLDAARFFFLQRSYDKHLIFDLDLAREQSQNNPVYYIQYAYARISTLLKKAGLDYLGKEITDKDFGELKEKEELLLIKKLIRFPEMIEDICKDYQVHRVAHYMLDLAERFHSFYQKCRIISDNKRQKTARLGLVVATKIVLKSVLDIMGISSPEKM